MRLPLGRDPVVAGGAVLVHGLCRHGRHGAVHAARGALDVALLGGVEVPVVPLDGHLVAPQAVAVEGGEAVDDDGDGQDEGEDAEHGAHRPDELARASVGLVNAWGR